MEHQTLPSRGRPEGKPERRRWEREFIRSLQALQARGTVFKVLKGKAKTTENSEIQQNWPLKVEREIFS